MKLEFRTKTNAYGMAHYLCIDTNAKTFSRVPDGWVSYDYFGLFPVGRPLVHRRHGLRRAGYDRISQQLTREE